MQVADYTYRASPTALAPSQELSVSDVTAASARISFASQAQGFQGVDGILGIGPMDLTQGTVSGQDQVPTVVDNLFSQGTIASDSLGIFYESTTQEAINGELIFGGADSSEYVAHL